MESFVRVVETGSFSEASRLLRVPKSTLSRRVSRLEDYLGVQLLMRTTRSLTLTEAGRTYYERARRIVEDILEAEEVARDTHVKPRGKLRLTAPGLGRGTVFVDLVTGFMEIYPEIDVEMELTHRFVDLIDEGFDLALRAGQLTDSSLVARRLIRTRNGIVGSQAFFEKHGIPESVEELSGLDAILMSSRAAGWKTTDGEFVPAGRVRMRSNELGAVYEAVRRGLGVAFVPLMLKDDEIVDEGLVWVLREEIQSFTGLYAVYPPNRYLSAKVRAFVDYAAEFFQKQPVSDECMSF